MRPKDHPKSKAQADMFRSKLTNILNHRHPLYALADRIEWKVFEGSFGPLYDDPQGSDPALPRPRCWLLRAVWSLCEDAGVPKVCAHSLRSTWATLTTDAAVPESVVAKALGHNSPAVTRQHYIEPGTMERVRVRKMLHVVQGGKERVRK